MNAVFMGTSSFAVPALERLVASPHVLLAVVTQPDRPQGRGRQIMPSAVKRAALAHGLPVLQPQRAREAAFVAELTALAPDVIVVAAYGQLLPPALIVLPAYGCINVHASLLPKYRGAAPVNWALIRGERVTGVTIMRMDETLDTGPILLQAALEIAPADDAGTLQERLAQLGAETLLKALTGLACGTLQPIPQDHRQATYAPKLRKEDGRIRWAQPAEAVSNRIRGVTPWPGALTTHAGNPLRIWRATAVAQATEEPPGTVARLDRQGIWVATSDGYIVLQEVQPAGGRRMDAAAYARGHGLRAGDILGHADDDQA
jgi:methionyl-tRNA formyltransferase